MIQDLRFALRLIRKHPAPVCIAVAGLAVAIGAVTSVFTLVDLTLVRPYGMDDPASVVTVGRPSHGGWPGWQYARFRQLQDSSTLATLEASMPARVRFATAAGDDGGAIRDVLFVSGGYMAVFGGHASRGRALAAPDDRPGAPAVIVVSDHFWRTALAADPDVAGRTVWLNGRAVVVAGVLQRPFTGPVRSRPSIWAPFAAVDDILGGPPFDARTGNDVSVVARLRPGATARTAEDQLSGAARGWTPARESDAPLRLYAAASPLDGPDDEETVFTLWATIGVLGLVLALACANTANLLMAAAVNRAQEIGVRRALGASPRRLLRQMLSESLLVSGAAGGLGLLMSIWLAPMLRLAVALPPEIDTAPDGRVLAFTIAVAVACGIGCGLSPARHGARGRLLTSLQSRGGSRGAGGPSRARGWLVGFQAAVSVLLFVVAGMLTRTAVARGGSAPGFDADRLLGVSVQGPGTGFDGRTYLQAAMAAVEALPGVERVSLTEFPVFGAMAGHSRVTREGRAHWVRVSYTDAGYLTTAGIAVLRGRPFEPHEVAPAAPVVLISAAAARTIFGDADPLGQRLPDAGPVAGSEAPVIVGIVNDTVADRLQRSDSAGAVYRPIGDRPAYPPGLLIRTPHPGSAARTIEAALLRLNPRIEIETWPVRERLDAYVAGSAMLAWLAAPVAVLAFLLAGLGLYGVTSFVAGQRRDEVGIRLALGASAADIRRLLVTDGLRPVAAGLAAGLPAAIGVAWTMAVPLSIDPIDPVAIAGALATLAAGALVAVVPPAREAARTDPACLFRHR